MRRRELLALLASAPLAACRGSRRSRATPIELAVPSDATTIDPRFPIDVYGVRIARLAHATLFARDADTLAPVPWLAEPLGADDLEGAGESVVVTILRDACFHDGTPVLAGDVVATWRAVLDERLGSPSRRIATELARIEALDGDSGRRVLFKPHRPRAVLLGDLDLPILKRDEAMRPRDAPLTGSGPFRVRDFTRGAVVLEPAPSYGRWAAPAHPARHCVVVRTVRDETARALRVLAGDTDVVSNALSPALAGALASRADAPAGLGVVRRPAAGTTLLTVQTERPPLDQVAVRRAIGMAIDRRALIDAKLGGAASIAKGLLPPTLADAPLQRAEWPVDAAAARDVLAPLGARGVRFALLASADRMRVGIARAIAQMISDAGVPVDVRVLEIGTFFARLAAGDFDLASLIAPEISDPDSLRWYLHSSARPPAGANRGRIRDPQIDELLDRGLATLVRAERRVIYGELEAVVRESAPMIPLWHEDHVAVVGERARGFVPSADGRWGALAGI